MRALLALPVALFALQGCGSSPRSTAPGKAQIAAAFAGSPAPLTRLHAQASAVIPSSPAAFKALLASLHGYPVVVNKWGSWCGPCRMEFPAFQQVSVRRGARVAFLGLDGGDNTADARSFLKRLPVSYPSYSDPDAHIAFALNAGSYYPTTLFYERSGKLAYLHAGRTRALRHYSPTSLGICMHEAGLGRSSGFADGHRPGTRRAFLTPERAARELREA